MVRFSSLITKVMSVIIGVLKVETKMEDHIERAL